MPTRKNSKSIRLDKAIVYGFGAIEDYRNREFWLDNLLLVADGEYKIDSNPVKDEGYWGFPVEFTNSRGYDGDTTIQCYHIGSDVYDRLAQEGEKHGMSASQYARRATEHLYFYLIYANIQDEIRA